MSLADTPLLLLFGICVCSSEGFFSCLVGEGVDSRLCAAGGMGEGAVDFWDCCEATGEAWARWITIGLDVITSDLTMEL